MSENSCIVCGSYILEPLYRPKDQPLAALSLPNKREDALSAPRYPMDFHMCASCGHIFNVAFDYSLIPYQNDSNLMYNAGSVWANYLQDAAKLIEGYGLKEKTVVDIGCGDGGFLKLLFDLEPNARYIGFEPGIEADNAVFEGVEIIKDFFLANRDMKEYSPDVIVCRHVIEHLESPREFVERIAYFALSVGISPIFVAEVPNIQNALNDLRVADYLYEHVSNFTPASLRTLFEICGFEVLELIGGYGDEVSLIIAKLKKEDGKLQTAKKAKQIREKLLLQKTTLDTTLKELKTKNKSIAIWGATGKGASFINSFELNADDYTIVVDSDERKCGRYTPGTGQLIRHSTYLLENHCDVIVATTNWRVCDISEEIKRRGIRCEKLLIVRNGNVEEVEIWTKN